MVDSALSPERRPARGEVRLRLLQAAEACLMRDGYAGLSTRAVAEAAGTPLSQIHYHFGSRQGLVLGLLEHQNEKLLQRQAGTLRKDAPLSARWLEACDHLEADVASGYVRVLQEIVAAGFSQPDMAKAARDALSGWFVLLNELSREAESQLGRMGALRPEEVACLIGLAFLGAESMILIGMDLPILDALRGVGRTLEALEGRGPGDGADAG